MSHSALHIFESNKEYARRAISRTTRHDSTHAVAVDAAVTIVPNFDMLRFEEKEICDPIFKHKEGCEWQFKYTKAEFQAFHRNKRVWEHRIDYYTINSNYQRYKYYSKSLGNAAGIQNLTSNLDAVENLQMRENLEEAL